ncbi:MAG: OmpA family protein [Flavobacteriaceae bacterium]|nr:OmpA family protein [Flavobacteriaceae bacterium]
MKKVVFALSILAFVSCKFNQNGNKSILPEEKGSKSNRATVAVSHTDTALSTTESSTESISQLDAAGNYIYNTGDIQEIQLPDGSVINVGSNSTESKLFSMLSDAGFTVNTDKTQDWVTLDRVYFNTGSDELTDASKMQIDNIVALLKAFPDAEVKLGGYTDNTGSQDINKPLSEGRAKSVLNDISASGINNNRLSAEGYGAEHPICPANDTDICKAQNRRVDIRIVKK